MMFIIPVVHNYSFRSPDSRPSIQRKCQPAFSGRKNRIILNETAGSQPKEQLSLDNSGCPTPKIFNLVEIKQELNSIVEKSKEPTELSLKDKTIEVKRKPLTSKIFTEQLPILNVLILFNPDEVIYQCDDTELCKYDIAELFLENGADPNQRNARGITPLMEAANSNDVQMCRILLKYGAKDDMTDLIGANALHWAAANGNDQVCKLLLSINPQLPAVKDNNGCLPIHLAVIKNRPAACQVLMFYGGDTLRMENRNKKRPIDCLNPHFSLVGSPVQTQDMQMQMALDPVIPQKMWKVCSEKIDFGDLEGALEHWVLGGRGNGVNNPELKTVSQKIYYLTQAGQTTVELETSVNVLTRLVLFAYQALKESKNASNGVDDLFKRFFQTGYDPNETNENGSTALHVAVACQSVPICELLIRYGASLDIKNDKGQTPLSIADPQLCAMMQKECKILGEAKGSLESLNDITSEGIQKRNWNKGDCERVCSAIKQMTMLTRNDIVEKINIQDKDGNSLLHWAAQNNDYQSYQILLDAGGNPILRNKKQELAYQLSNDKRFQEAQDQNGSSLLHWAVGNEDVYTLTSLLDDGADATLVDSRGRTPLHFATNAKFQFNAIAIRLIESVKRNKTKEELKAFLDLKDNEGNTALHLAAVNNLPRFCQILVNEGADYNLENNAGQKPLALIREQEAAWKVINDVQEKNKNANKLLNKLNQGRVSTIFKNPKILFYIKNNSTQETRGHFFNLLTAQDEEGNTLLHKAVEKNKYSMAADLIHCVKMLSAQDQKNVDQFLNQTNKAGQTALQLAADKNQKICEMLIQEGADYTLENQDSTTSRLKEIDEKNQEARKALQEVEDYGITAEKMRRRIWSKDEYYKVKNAMELQSYATWLSFKPLLDIRDLEGNTLMVWLGKQQDDNLCQSFYDALIQKLPNIGLDVKNIINKRDINGCTSLYMAAKNRLSKTCTLLIQRGANPGLENTMGLRPLHIAAANGDLNTCESLFQCLADTIVRDNDGLTPLHLAVLKGNDLDTVDWLIQRLQEYAPTIKQAKAIDLDLKDNYGRTPLHLAVKGSKLEMFTKLFKAEASILTEDNQGMTPLHLAVEVGSPEFLQGVLSLVKKKYDEDKKDFQQVLTSLDGKGNTLLHAAAKMKRPDVVRVLLENGANAFLKDKHSLIPLRYAVLHNDAESVQLLIQAMKEQPAGVGENIEKVLNDTDEYGNTALHWASSHGNFEACKEYLLAGAAPFTKNLGGRAPMDMTSCPEIRRLFEFTAATAPVIPESSGWFVDSDDMLNSPEGNYSITYTLTTPEGGSEKKKASISPLTLFVLRYNPKKAEADEELMKKLESFKESIPLQTKNENGSTALHVAAVRNIAPLCKLFVKHGINPFEKNSKGQTPVSLTTDPALRVRMRTIYYENQVDNILRDAGITPETGLITSWDKALCENVIKAAASFDQSDLSREVFAKKALGIKDKDGLTALNWAVKHRESELFAEFLLLGQDILTSDNQGMTPLHWAAANGDLLIAEELLFWIKEVTPERVERFSNFLDIRDSKERTPLHCAVESGSIKTVQALIDAGANLIVKDKEWDLLLHKAVESGSPQMVQLLVNKMISHNPKKAVKVLNTPDSRDNENTLLHKAVQRGDVETAKLLTAAGADVMKEDAEGYLPLHRAVVSGSSQTVKLLVNKMTKQPGQSIERVAEIINTPDLRDSENTLLHKAVQRGDVETAQVLIAAGADVMKEDAEGYLPLHRAVVSGSSQTVQLLVNKMAQQPGQSIERVAEIINTPDLRDSENTLLHKAAQRKIKGGFGVCKILIKAGADPRLKNADDQRPVDLAYSKNIGKLLTTFEDFKTNLEKGVPLLRDSFFRHLPDAELQRYNKAQEKYPFVSKKAFPI